MAGGGNVLDEEMKWRFWRNLDLKFRVVRVEWRVALPMENLMANSSIALSPSSSKSPRWSDEVEKEEIAKAVGKTPMIVVDKAQEMAVIKKAEKVKGKGLGKDPVTANPNPSKKTWASVVADNRNPDLCMKLKFIPPGDDGVVEFLRVDLMESEEVWKNSVVGYFLGAKPSFKEMVGFVNRSLRGIQIPRIHLLKEGSFCLILLVKRRRKLY